MMGRAGFKELMVLQRPKDGPSFSHFVGGTSRAKDGEQEGKKSRKEEGSRIEGVRVKGLKD